MEELIVKITVADPGFPVEGSQPPMWALFGKIVYQNERIGFGCAPGSPSE